MTYNRYFYQYRQTKDKLSRHDTSRNKNKWTLFLDMYGGVNSPHIEFKEI